MVLLRMSLICLQFQAGWDFVSDKLKIQSQYLQAILEETRTYVAAEHIVGSC